MQSLLTATAYSRWARRLKWALLSLGLVLAGSVIAHETQDEPTDTVGDAANQVARISYLKGSVSVRGGADEWQSARINLPLVPGDALATNSQARAELQTALATVQIEEESQVAVDVLDDNQLRLKLESGSVFVRVHGDDVHVAVATGNARVQLKGTGRYRITAWQDDVTQLQVRDGDAEIQGERQAYPAHRGEQVTLRGVRHASVDYDDVAKMDDFDRWVDERNERPARGSSSQYVNREVIGYEDLDDHGYWRYEAEYGYVWSPTTVMVGWAPYRYGRWSWVAPWGWTWIDDAPWGFAPFHYGRWAHLRNRWCWVPGPRAVRPVYAPALVAWMGTPSLGIRLATAPNVGWIPLGPRDIYRPYFRHSDDYARHVNLSGGRISGPEFERGWRQQPHDVEYGNRFAATVVASSRFQRGDAVQHHFAKPRDGGFTVTDQAPLRPAITPNPSAEHGVPFWNRGGNDNSRFDRAPERSWPTWRGEAQRDDHVQNNRPRWQPAPGQVHRDEPVITPPENRGVESGRSPGWNRQPSQPAPAMPQTDEAPRERRVFTPWVRPDMNRDMPAPQRESPPQNPEPRSWQRPPDAGWSPPARNQAEPRDSQRGIAERAFPSPAPAQTPPASDNTPGNSRGGWHRGFGREEAR